MPLKRTNTSAAAYGALLTTLQIATLNAKDADTEEGTVEALPMSIVGVKVKMFTQEIYPKPISEILYSTLFNRN